MTIAINTELCNGCLKCIKVCPMKVLEINDKAKAESVRLDFCVHCAHCMCVCPVKAISAGFIDSKLGKSTKSLDLPTSEQIENFMLTRRSIRAYSEKSVDRETIKKILKIAVHAPTTHNDQNVKFIIVESDKSGELETLAHNYFIGLKEDQVGIITREAGFKILLGAPVTIALYANKSGEGDMNLVLWNSLIEAQNLLLAAHGMGLGGCYNGLLLFAYRNDHKLRKFFNLPEDKQIYMFVGLGYPNHTIKYRNIIIRKEPDITWK